MRKAQTRAEAREAQTRVEASETQTRVDARRTRTLDSWTKGGSLELDASFSPATQTVHDGCSPVQSPVRRVLAASRGRRQKSIPESCKLQGEARKYGPEMAEHAAHEPMEGAP